MNVAERIKQHYDGGLNWMQGAYVDNKSMCLVGALGNFLMGARTDESFGEIETKLDSDPAAILLAVIIRAEYPQRVPFGRSSASDTIINFNDDDDTTYADVERVLEKLAARIEEYVE